MYLDEFRQTKRSIQRKLQKNFNRFSSEIIANNALDKDIITSVTKDIRPSKNENNFLNFTGSISNIRSFLYALMCGGNNQEFNEIELLAACNKYGVDNPTQTITRRLSLYGNDEIANQLL